MLTMALMSRILLKEILTAVKISAISLAILGTFLVIQPWNTFSQSKRAPVISDLPSITFKAMGDNKSTHGTIMFNKSLDLQLSYSADFLNSTVNDLVVTQHMETLQEGSDTFEIGYIYGCVISAGKIFL